MKTMVLVDDTPRQCGTVQAERGTRGVGTRNAEYVTQWGIHTLALRHEQHHNPAINKRDTADP